ncbi:peptidyl-prolyl cis-trans isomerase [Paenibacillus sp. GCM10028914]|uniref:peptidylprolyl isomerase n=1 Tax=Paenibacillus sp. GCM10028914 TaxID=3273416 RepID=UPI003607C4E2
MKKMMLLLGSVLFIGLVMLFILSTPRDQEETTQMESGDIVAYVNSIPVAQEEMNLIMQLSGQSATGGHNSDQAIDRMLEIKTAQQIAVKYDIMKDSSFSVFLKELDAENKRRADALNNKEVIYGPKQYTKLTYYDYRHSNMLNSLKLMWSEQELDIGDQKLMDYYEQHRDRLAKKHDTIKIYKIVQPKTASGDAEQKIFEIERDLKAGQAFMEIYQQLEEEQGLTEIETINEDNYKEISKYHSGYYHLVSGLSQGEVSDVLEDETSFFIVRIADVKPGGYKEFAEMREEVIRQYTDDYFESFLEQQMLNSEVRLEH